MVIVAERNYGIDLLKSLSMAMVIALHVLNFGDWLYRFPTASHFGMVVWLIEIFSYCAVDCFVMITGYLYVRSRYRYSNLVTLWMQVLMFSAGIALLFQAMGWHDFTAKELLKYFLPVGYGKYWFFTSYTILFLFIPLLNAAIKSLSRRQLMIICLTLFAFISLYQSVLVRDSFTVGKGYSPWWFLVLYLFGATARLMEDRHVSVRRCLLIFIGLGLLTWVSRPVLAWIVDVPEGYFARVNMLCTYISPTITMMAFLLMMACAHLEVPRRLASALVFLSPLSFGVYLLHEHPLVRPVLARFSAALPSDNPLAFSLSVLFLVAVVFVCGIMVDYPRSLLFRALRISDRVESMERKVLSRVNWGAIPN